MASKSFAISINQLNGGRHQDHFYLDYVICQFHPKIVVNGTCKLNFITRMQKSITVTSFVTSTIDNIMARVQLFYKFRIGYQPLLIDVTTNACEFMRGNVESKVMDFIMSAVRPYSARNFTCPYIGVVSVKNMPINMGIVDYLFLPAGNYMLNLSLVMKDELIWGAKLFFILPEGKTAEDDRMGR